MTVRRGFLYTGVFLLATGGVVLLAQAGTIDTEAVTRALKLPKGTQTLMLLPVGHAKP